MKDNEQIIEKLEPNEKKEYKRLLAVVRSGLDGFMEAGRALMEIREKRLYREQFTSFEEFVKTEFKMSKPHATRVIGAYSVVEGLSEAGHKMLPSSERVARELGAVPEEMRAQVWERAQELVGPDREPDTKSVREAVLEVLPPEQRTRTEELELLTRLRAAERNLIAANGLITEEMDSNPSTTELTLDLCQSIWRTLNSIKKTANEKRNPEPA
jgi:hypothetical protein